MSRTQQAAFGLAVIFTLCCGVALGQNKTEPRQTPEPIKTDQLMRLVGPYLTDSTLFIGYADAARVDAPGFARWWGTLLDRLKIGSAPEVQQAKMAPMMVEVFRKQFVGAGGRHVFVVFTLPESMDPDYWRPLFVLPVEPGGSVDKLLAAVPEVEAYREDGRNYKMYKMAHGNAVVVGGKLELEALLRARAAVLRPDLANALRSVEGRTARAALMPTDDMRRVIDEMMPNLPAKLGGEPTTTFTRGVRWMAAGAGLGAEPSVVLINEADTPEHAAALHRFVQGLPDVIERQMEYVGDTDKAAFKMMRQAVKLLPEPRGKRIEAAFDDQQFADRTVELVGPFLHVAREKADANVSMSHMRQQLQACLVYAMDHKDRWPDSLAQVAQQGIIDKRTLHNPRNLTNKQAYVYLKPDAPLSELKNAGKTVLIYEAYDQWPQTGCYIGFADGTVVLYENERDFKRVVEAKVLQ